MSADRLADIQERARRDYAARESGIYLSNELVSDRLELLGEVHRLAAELRLAEASLRDAEAALADYRAEIVRLRGR